MSWVTVIWSMTASACLTLALVNFLIWCRQRSAWANLLFALMAVATAAIAGFELAMMRAVTPESFGLALRWLHVPAWVIVVSLAWFVRLYLNAGRGWLLWSICGLHTISLILNFLLGQSLNYWEITRLRHIPFLGESISVADGVLNHWMLVGQASFLMLLIFVVDATAAAWWHGDRRRALVVGSSVAFFVFAATGEATLALWHVIQWPIVASLPALVMVGAMSLELSRDAQRAGQLAGELRETEQRMILATEAAGLGIWIRDMAGNGIWASDRWRELFGFTKTEPLDFERFLQRLHPDDREEVRAAMEKAVAGTGHYKKEYRVMLPDGGLRWISARGRIEFNGDGRPVLARGTATDITERKRSEQEITHQRNVMTHLSRISTVNELSTSLAHELNQPLTAILSNAQAAQRFLAQDAADLDNLREILTDIVAQDKRAGEIIRRLRLLLKKGEVQQQPLDMNEVVQEALKLVRSDLLNHGAAAHAELAPGLPAVTADRVQILQVLLNLVMNACDAMAGRPAGDRRVILSTESADGGGVCISIADQGTGIAPDHLEKIFEPFFTTKTQGMGLGLSVCRTIVAVHGGKLWATNNLDRGATFHVTLPIATETNP